MGSLLQQQQLDTLSEMFHVRYHISLPPWLAPSDALVSRLSKELEKRLLSVRDVVKSKTLEHQLRRQKKKVMLSEHITLLQDEQDEEAQGPHTVAAYLDALLTLLYAYAVARVSRLPTAPAVESKLRTRPLWSRCRWTS